MLVFLIDYENESGRVLEGISLLGLTRKDEIVIFYSKSASRITMELHRELENIKAKKSYIRVETGTANALDFQLVTYLGACVHENSEKEYYIISKDSGYDCVCRNCRSKKIVVKRIERLSYYKAGSVTRSYENIVDDL